MQCFSGIGQGQKQNAKNVYFVGHLVVEVGALEVVAVVGHEAAAVGAEQERQQQ